MHATDVSRKRHACVLCEPTVVHPNKMSRHYIILWHRLLGLVDERIKIKIVVGITLKKRERFFLIATTALLLRLHGSSLLGRTCPDVAGA